MKEQLEIIISQFKMRNSLDIYSELSVDQLNQLTNEIIGELHRLNWKLEAQNINGTL